MLRLALRGDLRSFAHRSESPHALNRACSAFCARVGAESSRFDACMQTLCPQSARVIENAEGARTTPSMVAFTDKGEKLVGMPAKRQARRPALIALCFSLKGGFCPLQSSVGELTAPSARSSGCDEPYQHHLRHKTSHWPAIRGRSDSERGWGEKILPSVPVSGSTGLFTERCIISLQMVPYKIIRADNGDAWVEVTFRCFSSSPPLPNVPDSVCRCTRTASSRMPTAYAVLPMRSRLPGTGTRRARSGPLFSRR